MNRLIKPHKSLRIFLCHSSDDKPTVRELYIRLLKDGFEPWLDEKALLPGQNWEQEIPKAVRNSDVIIVCLSTGSISKSGYVQREIKFALDVADEQLEGTIFLIPLKLEKCDIPDQLKRWQWVNLFEKGGYEWLLQSLQYRASTLGRNLKRSRGIKRIPTNPQMRSINEEVLNSSKRRDSIVFVKDAIHLGRILLLAGGVGCLLIAAIIGYGLFKKYGTLLLTPLEPTPAPTANLPVIAQTLSPVVTPLTTPIPTQTPTATPAPSATTIPMPTSTDNRNTTMPSPDLNTNSNIDTQNKNTGLSNANMIRSVRYELDARGSDNRDLGVMFHISYTCTGAPNFRAIASVNNSSWEEVEHNWDINNFFNRPTSSTLAFDLFVPYKNFRLTKGQNLVRVKIQMYYPGKPPLDTQKEFQTFTLIAQ